MQQKFKQLKNNKTWFWFKHIILLALFTLFVVVNIMEPTSNLKYLWHWGIWLPLTSYIVFWEGRKYFKSYPKLFKGILDSDTLIAFASHVLYVFSFIMVIFHWNDAMFSYDQMWEGTAALVVITNIGHKIEDNIKQSSIEAYNKLSSMLYAKVIKIVNNKHIEVEANEIKVGDTILVQKGQIITLDGIISEEAAFNYSNITGESQEVILSKGEEVVSGAFCLDKTIQIKVTKDSSHSTLSVIVDRIEEVSLAKPQLQKIADKILKWFIPTVLLIAALTIITWIVVGYTTDFRLPWMNHAQASWIIAITAGVTVIAIACPCALGIATPLVYSVSSMISNQRGILINEPKALEELSRINLFAFDKTGTITTEKFEIQEIIGDHKWIPIAKGLEVNAKHTISDTIMSVKGKVAKVINIKVTRTSIDGIYNKSQVVMQKSTLTGPTTNVALFVNKKEVLTFKLKNTIKEGVKETIAFLKKQNIKVAMITGDNEEVANFIAKEVGIDHVYANIDPVKKHLIIKELQKKCKVGFVGDGFNDTIAIKQANVSISFSSGSDITNSLSNVSITSNNFTTIKDLTIISRLNNKAVKVSLTYAFLFNFLTIPIAFLLLVQPWMGASIMAISDVLVASNTVLYKIVLKRKLKKINK